MTSAAAPRPSSASPARPAFRKGTRVQLASTPGVRGTVVGPSVVDGHLRVKWDGYAFPAGVKASVLEAIR